MHEETVCSIWQDLKTIRDKRPLIHNITNLVVTQFSANALLALGASPLMSHAIEEQEEIVSLSDALVLNIGTLDQNQIDSMLTAVQFANRKGIPILIDPVGAGASRFRTKTVQTLLERSEKAVLKGNASEILALSNQISRSRGVDSLHASDQALAAARTLLETHDLQGVAISGEEDFVLDRTQCVKLSNGSDLMPKVTGMGCILTALTGAFCAGSDSLFSGVRNAVSYVGICGEIAARNTSGPGGFHSDFLDQLHNTTQEQIRDMARVETC